eukprot:TRINITY_DN641_c0_g1_i4.p2 TRINITY_DN641_c0_g1~~TRINITY_DN641_c0_g1_i4.p2  ORF type:complete len:198 (+),score=24.70 TRINITY_DN641_c0_g1_i4:572-1165(+)
MNWQLTVNASQFYDNVASVHGGGLYTAGQIASAYNDVRITSNQATQFPKGNGVFGLDDNGSFLDSTFSNNALYAAVCKYVMNGTQYDIDLPISCFNVSLGEEPAEFDLETELPFLNLTLPEFEEKITVTNTIITFASNETRVNTTVTIEYRSAITEVDPNVELEYSCLLELPPVEEASASSFGGVVLDLLAIFYDNF